MPPRRISRPTYLYIQGHHLFDTVVSPILSKVCNLLRQERQNEIYHASAHKTQKRNEMSCYENSLQDIKVMLKKNTGYMCSEQFRQVQDVITWTRNRLFRDDDTTHRLDRHLRFSILSNLQGLQF